jgi:hypothetical protein
MDSVPVNISLLSTVTKLVVKDKDDSSDDIEDSVDAAAVLEGKYLLMPHIDHFLKSNEVIHVLGLKKTNSSNR